MRASSFGAAGPTCPGSDADTEHDGRDGCCAAIEARERLLEIAAEELEIALEDQLEGDVVGFVGVVDGGCGRDRLSGGLVFLGAAGEELDVPDDPDAAAVAAVVGLSGVVLQDAVDGDGGAVAEIAGGRLAGGAEGRDVEEPGVLMAVAGAADGNSGELTTVALIS